ncbi:uncharacterized protein LOC129602045 [Paramacrobiotus metropolitanus]|uniref:uncharacterized protein LOC129602045 n=1 Tax=Paramacrobiotus metropolitanus TaxID=2943436 RepID=UPI0024462000|nr:uncharacterized protein LOC129602045 [Paramacrobiotus metropolitanus]
MARKNFLMFNAPAMGHIIPLFELAHRISAYHDVTFVISKSFVPKLTERNIINSMDIMKPSVVTLLKSMPLSHVASSEPVGEELPKLGISELLPVDAVIFDQFLTGFVPEHSHKRGVPCFEFIPSSNIRNRADRLHTRPPQEQADIGVWLQQKQHSEQFLAGRIVNNFRESVPPRQETLPTFYVGPLFPLETAQKAVTPLEQTVKTFLDSHPQRSVIYFAFGTVVRAAPAQIAEIHHALTALQRPYIWSLAEPLHQYLPADRQPDDGGHLILPWVPQKLILQHPSVAVFVTHAGWNSTVEGLMGGVPMVAWPGFADQHDNAAWVESIGVGVTVPNTKLGPDARVVPSKEIEAWISKAAGWDAVDGVSPFARKCTEWKEISGKAWMDGGNSTTDFQLFLELFAG